MVPRFAGIGAKLQDSVRWWPIALIVVGVGVLHRNLLLGQLPATGDHQCHLFRGWLMAEQLIPTGRLTGWSHFAFAGYPAGYYYPIGGDLYLAAGRYLSLSSLSWETLYCLCLFGVLLLFPLVVYGLARRAAGPAGALIAALLAAGDVGGWRQGGSVFTIYWGVWPYMLAVCLSLAALRGIEPATLRSLRRRPVAAAGLAGSLALAVMTHPMAAIFLAVAVPLYVVMVAITKRGEVSPRRVVLRAFAVGGLALAMALFWLIPPLKDGGAMTESFGQIWLPLGQMFAALFTNRLFDQFSWIAWGLGLLGIALGLLSRRSGPIVPAVLIIATIFFAGLAGPLLDEKVQLERMAGFIKGLWFVQAGIAVDRLAHLSKGVILRRTGRFFKLGSRLSRLGAAAGAALALAIIFVDWHNYGKVAAYRTRDPHLWQAVTAADRWLAANAAGPLDRVLHVPGRICDSGNVRSRACRKTYDNHLFAASPVRNGLPKVKFGFEPAAVFKNMPLTNHWPGDTAMIKQLYTEPKALAHLGINWVVSLTPWTGRSDLQEVARYGRVRIYRVSPSFPGPVFIDGPGRLVLDRFDDERIEVTVEGAGPRSTVRFPIAFHPSWRAEVRGKALPVERTAIVPGQPRKLIGIPAVNGELTLRFVRPWYHRVGSWISLSAWLGCLGWIGAVRWRRKKGITPLPSG